MKKLLLLILSIIIFTLNPVSAQEFIPGNMNSFSSWGVGVYFVPTKYKILKEPDINSELLEHIYYNEFGIDSFFTNLKARDSFLVFLPSKKTVLLTVNSDDNEFINVYYNQKNPKTGWIKKSQEGQFYNWLNFMKIYGRKNGVYFLQDIPSKYKRLYTSPNENAQEVKSNYEFIKEMKTVTIKGNWMLVKLTDVDKKTHIGWIKWRNDIGQIMVFPVLNRDNYDF